MIRTKIIIDTGPLVSFMNKNDAYHDWTKNQFSMMSPPFISCEAVISEACFLLRKFPNGQDNILELIERNLLILPFDLQSESQTIKKLIKKYQNIPMSLADACLVRLSEQISDSVVCTLDSDFEIYRKNKRERIPLIIPNFRV